MRDPEEVLIEALSYYGISPAATRNLIERARERSGLGKSPEDWLALAEGPLVEEVREIIPVFPGMAKGSRYAEAVKRLREELSPLPKPPPRANNPGKKRRYRLSDPKDREALLSQVAREAQAVGVALVSKEGQATRLPGVSEEWPRLLLAAHRLLSRRRPYRVGYLVVEGGEVYFRSLGDYLLVVLTRRGANTGRILNMLAAIEAEEGGK